MRGKSRGKEAFVEFMVKNGFSVDQSDHIYRLVCDYIRSALVDGVTIVFRGVCRIRADLHPARTYRDNLNNKLVHFGERVIHRFVSLINQ